MVDIISKRTGPREEDRRIKQFLAENQPTITRLADHLSGGQYSARKQKPEPAPRPDDAVIHHIGKSTPPMQIAQHVRISPNGRVVLMDQNSGRQLHYLGEIRTRAGEDHFILATAKNGFIAPLDAELAARLQELDQLPLDHSHSELDLLHAIETALGLI